MLRRLGRAWAGGAGARGYVGDIGGGGVGVCRKPLLTSLISTVLKAATSKSGAF